METYFKQVSLVHNKSTVTIFALNKINIHAASTN